MILLDVDDVIADFRGHAEGVVGRIAWGLPQPVTLAQRATLDRAMAQPGWCESMPERPGAVALVRRIRQPFAFVTKPFRAGPTWAYERTRWLEARFPGVPVVFTATKWAVRGTLLDDTLEHVQAHRDRGQDAHLVAPGPEDPGRSLEDLLTELEAL